MERIIKKLKKAVSQVRKETLEYPCEECIVDACCTTACEEFETWLNQAGERRYNKERKSDG